MENPEKYQFDHQGFSYHQWRMMLERMMSASANGSLHPVHVFRALIEDAPVEVAFKITKHWLDKAPQHFRNHPLLAYKLFMRLRLFDIIGTNHDRFLK